MLLRHRKNKQASAAFVPVFAICTLYLGCVSVGWSRTIGKDHLEVSGEVGGPLMGVRDVVFPTPRHLIGMRYGLLEEVDFFTQLGIDLLLFKILLIDGGFVGQLFRNPQGPAGAASARLHLLFDLDDLVLPRLFPEAGIHFDHPLDSSFALLWGALLFLEPHPAYDRPDFFFAPYVGIDWIFRGMPDPRIEREKSALALGVSWINPWEGRNTFIRFFPDGMGAIAVILSFRYVKR